MNRSAKGKGKFKIRKEEEIKVQKVEKEGLLEKTKYVVDRYCLF